MKTILTIIILLSFTLAFSQQISYTYDASGNRIKREYAILRKKSLPANTEKDTVVQSQATFQVKAYPNPFSEQVTINIEMQEELKEQLHLLLFNELGQLIQEFYMKQKLKTIQTQNLAKGKYYIRIIRKEESEEFILIKN